jgi:hypothetical protein
MVLYCPYETRISRYKKAMFSLLLHVGRDSPIPWRIMTFTATGNERSLHFAKISLQLTNCREDQWSEIREGV